MSKLRFYAAKLLGFEMPAMLLARANEVIEYLVTRSCHSRSDNLVTSLPMIALWQVLTITGLMRT